MKVQSSDKQYYDNQKVENLNMFAKKIRLYFDEYKHLIETKFKNKHNIVVLELGAGSCTLSLLISSYSFVGKVICYDISTERMQSLVLQNAKNISCVVDKLEFVGGDFSEKIPFDSNSIDIILFDASLHHTRSMWNTLSECKRVLKKDGLLVAQRESALGRITYKFKLRKLLQTEEVKSGVSENAYLKEQYEYYFNAIGFKTLFIPMAETILQRSLKFLNGFAYSKWIIIANIEQKNGQN